MTQDISQHGTRFETSHIYAPGDKVLAKIPWGEWSKTGEVAGRVVRVESVEDVAGPRAGRRPGGGQERDHHVRRRRMDEDRDNPECPATRFFNEGSPFDDSPRKLLARILMADVFHRSLFP